MRRDINPPLLPITADTLKLKETWLNTTQTAQILDTTPETLAVWRCKGEYQDLRWKKRGRRIFYLLQDVERFMSSCPYGNSRKVAG